MFWTGSLSARERLMIDRDCLDEVRQRLRRRFAFSRVEAATLAARARLDVLPGYLRRSRRRRCR